MSHSERDRVRAMLLAAKTPQEFLVQLEAVTKTPLTDQAEDELLRTVRHALGEVMNKSTVTWIPKQQEVTDDR